jgi:hypothetical protein
MFDLLLAFVELKCYFFSASFINIKYDKFENELFFVDNFIDFINGEFLLFIIYVVV